MSPRVAPEPDAARDEPTHPMTGRLLVLDSIEISRADQQVLCKVRLCGRGETVVGTGRDIDSEHGRARAAVKALVDAVEEAVAGVAFGIEGIQIAELFGRRYVVVSIEAALARRRDQVPGIAEISESVEDAACLAALTAIEGWLEGRG